MKYKSKHIVEYLLFRLIAGVVFVLPLRVGLGLAWLVAAGTHFLGRINVERTRARIRAVFGDQKSEKEVRHIAWIAWRNLCFSAIESIRFPKMTLEKFRKQPMAHLEDRLLAAVKACEAGCIIVTPHFGNWEISGIACDLVGVPLFTIVRKQKNILMNNFINKMRQSFNLELLYREARMWKGVTDRLKQGKVLAILPDVNQKSGTTVDYLGGRATVPPGAARFAQMAQCPIFPVVSRRIGWAKHDAILFDPIFPDPTADKTADQQRMMQEIMTVFSKEVLKTPEQYFWYNKRWVLDS
ncbi:MAG: lysophospholipid acyltransferase family protein [Kiritimatiellaceae bacterium]|nr:lysophospholipid acyltransferase family protein [Kiritimatiellaceae bacterium]